MAARTTSCRRRGDPTHRHLAALTARYGGLARATIGITVTGIAGDSHPDSPKQVITESFSAASQVAAATPPARVSPRHPSGQNEYVSPSLSENGGEKGGGEKGGFVLGLRGAAALPVLGQSSSRRRRHWRLLLMRNLRAGSAPAPPRPAGLPLAGAWLSDCGV